MAHVLGLWMCAVKRHKNDAADAEAICEAVTRPSMRFVVVKTTEQQSAQADIPPEMRNQLAELGLI